MYRPLNAASFALKRFAPIILHSLIRPRWVSQCAASNRITRRMFPSHNLISVGTQSVICGVEMFSGAIAFGSCAHCCCVGHCMLRMLKACWNSNEPPSLTARHHLTRVFRNFNNSWMQNTPRSPTTSNAAGALTPGPRPRIRAGQDQGCPEMVSDG